MANRVDSANRWFAPCIAKSGAFGTGRWTDTSPRFGCCMATEDALRELAANAAASNFSLTVVRSQQSLVPVWELVDFVGRQFPPTRLLFSPNQEAATAYTTDQVHQHQSHRRGE